MPPKALEKQLRNIGPVTSRQLLKIGIDSLEKLKEVGAEEAYKRICELDDFDGEYHAAYLYALEGAILGCDWRDIPASKKKAYKGLTATWRKGQKARRYFKKS
ncbi:MAG: TfoX/Sxy family DNA transformation protein [Bacteroidota bacterium]